MQIVEELEGPLTPEERAGMIINLLEMIDHWNAGIERHLSYDEPDQFTITEFTDRRNSYIAQLALLLQKYGVVVQLPSSGQSGRQQAA